MNRYKGGKKGREKIQKKGEGERLRWTHLEISIKIIGRGKKRGNKVSQWAATIFIDP